MLVGSVLLTVFSYAVVSSLHRCVGDSIAGLTIVLLSAVLSVFVFFMLVCVGGADRRRLCDTVVARFKYRGEM